MFVKVPKVEFAPAFSIESYPQVYPQPVQGGRGYPQAQESRPPYVKFCTTSTYTPQQKIYAKVRYRNVLVCTHIKVTLVTNRK